MESRIANIEHRLGLSEIGSESFPLADLHSRLFSIRDAILQDQATIKDLTTDVKTLQQDNQKLRETLDKSNYRVNMLVKSIKQVDPNPVPRPQV
ncbi:hypothetical protein RCL1_002814 [Eukaryota sp. TZLM3-RCL]